MWNLQQRKTATETQPALIVLDQKQPETPLKTDNFITEGFVNLGMKKKRSKTYDMKWNWLRDKEVLEKLRVHWDIGTKTKLIMLQNTTFQFTIVKCDLGIYIPRF